MGKTRVRAGNYIAPVDTQGMDKEMKQTLGVGITTNRYQKPTSPPKMKPDKLAGIKKQIEEKKAINRGYQALRRMNVVYKQQPK